ncbi:hypothetical protein ABWH96_12010 [Marivirga tractuosa]|uniref:DUF7379 domain-containing protein n=1 Tax=Marivirga tractuosa TaxID=1006 RepID=UPI0035CF85CA
MRPLTLSTENQVNFNEKSFYLLGDDNLNASIVNQKLSHEHFDDVEGLWGTLGAGDGNTDWTGKLKFSRKGNKNSEGALSDEIRHLKKLHPEIKTSGKRIIEYFINFDDVNFVIPETATLKDWEQLLPSIRLTLFLQKTEGALVYYEWYEGTYRAGKSCDLEHLLVESTENFGFDRDRLNFYLKALPQHAILSNSDSVNENTELQLDRSSKRYSLVIKVLKFFRDRPEESAEAKIEKMLTEVMGDKKYSLLKYNSIENDFIALDKNSPDINTSYKTLLLLHGTFSSTSGSFGDLLEMKIGKYPLKALIEDGTYEQIIGFDHLTILDDAKGNANELKKLLANHKFPQDNPVDVITTSRGGLLAKYLYQNEEFQNEILPIRRLACCACANGVNYFDVAAPKVVKFLNILKQISHYKSLPFATIITGFLEFSSNFFLQLKGSQMMTPGNEFLNQLITAKPIHSETKIKAIAGDWDKQILADYGLLRRWSAVGLDKLIWLVFKGDNDWVVKTENQLIMPEDFAVEAYHIKSFHCNYFDYQKTFNGGSHQFADTFNEIIKFFND